MKLINHYYELFREYGITCGQVLTTKENFSTRRHYLNQQHCMSVMLENGVIPIVNENDTISLTELMFTDNDELSGLIAAMMDVEALIILSNIDGIYNGNPTDPASSVLREIGSQRDDLAQYICTGKSQFGRGGMLTKCRIAMKVADEGIEVIVANGKRDNILPQLLAEQSEVVSTRFVPAPRTISQVKNGSPIRKDSPKAKAAHQRMRLYGSDGPVGDEPAADRRKPCGRRVREGRYRPHRRPGRRTDRGRARRL